MKILRGFRIISKLRYYLNPVKYARSIGVMVGENTSIMTPYFGTEPWLISIGDHVKVTANVRFITHDGGSWVFREKEKYQSVKKFGKIEIKNNCFIGNNVIIMPGVTIGPNAVVGAGAVVTKNIPEGTVAAGVPAKVIMTVEEYAEKSLKATPAYDPERYKKDRKSEILRMLNGG